MSDGYIYCLSNEAMPGIVKIGEVHTDGRTPEDRVRELYTTGVPLPFRPTNISNPFPCSILELFKSWLEWF